MIQVENLSKTYRVAKKQAGLAASIRGLLSREWTEVHAVRDLSFDIERGERVGFLGPNGAGKTTTLKMLAGLLTPTAGRVSVLGIDPRDRPPELLRQITLVMGQKQQLLWDLPPIETMELNRAVYEIEPAEYRASLGSLTEMLGLEPLLNKPTRQLSLGERMKCELAAALLHRPQVLFLDEPTIGLDVNMQTTVRNFIRDYNAATQATVILTSHYMEDVNALCPRVIVVDQGHLRHDGDLVKLVEDTHPDKRVDVRLRQPIDEAALNAIQIDNASFELDDQDATHLSVRAPRHRIAEIVKAIIEALDVSDLRVEEPPLEEVMKQVFGGAGPDAG